MKQTLKFGFGILGLILIGVLIAWATSPDPKFNPASFEETPLVESVAPLGEAVTLAQFTDDQGSIGTIIVTGFDKQNVTGVDIKELGGISDRDPFQALGSIDAILQNLESVEDYPSVTVTMDNLLPSGSAGDRHIGTGTNFPEHAEEANSGSVFSFPKFGRATPARTTIAVQPGILLDYEVELCMRFDRDITSLEDFDAAKKGLFLCGDFTNRNALVELADPDNLDSGTGFSDSKSGPGHFPTGPFIVIPKDWEKFVADLRMTTSLNGELRQDARGGEMTLNFRDLAEKALGDMSKPRFLYKNGYELLAPNAQIDQDMTLMSGTSEGVIFTTPSRGDMIEAVAGYLSSGGPLGEPDFMDGAKTMFIKNELNSGHFLKAGDRVRHGSSYLGNIEVGIVNP